MAVSTPQQLKGFYDAIQAAGAKAINSDFALQIDGFEANWFLCKQAPWPVVAPAGEISVPGPLGIETWQPQQIKVGQQGQITLQETVAGTIDQMLIDIITSRAVFNAWIYEGTPQRFLRAKRVQDCFLQVDNPDRDNENRSQVLVFTGTMFFHYFGEIKPGNAAAY